MLYLEQERSEAKSGPISQSAQAWDISRLSEWTAAEAKKLCPFFLTESSFVV